MTRFFASAMLTPLILAIPFALSAQSTESPRAAHAAASPAEAPSGCSAFDVADSGGGPSPTTAAQAGHGFDLSNLDRSVLPCNDFYKFANGGWMKNNPVPADRSTWATYSKLMDRNEEELRGILEEAAKDKSPSPGSNWQKIGDFYASCMDESAIEAAGTKPLDSIFQEIAQIKDLAGLQAEIARLQRRERRLRVRFRAGLQGQHASDRRCSARRVGPSRPPVLSR